MIMGMAKTAWLADMTTKELPELLRREKLQPVHADGVSPRTRSENFISFILVKRYVNC